MILHSCLLSLALLGQAGGGWLLVESPPREVKRLYWELLTPPTTEVWVRLVPQDPEGKPALVNLVFEAFFPGRVERDPYNSLLPEWPKGRPARLAVTAQANPVPFTGVREFSLRLLVDGKVVDLTADSSRYRTIPSCSGSDCGWPNGLEADLDPAVLISLTTAETLDGEALGLPIRLTTLDRLALREFARRTALAPELRR